MAEGIKIIGVLGIVLALFIFLPNIIALGFDLPGDTGGTLSQTEDGRAGFISISFDGGNTFRDASLDMPGSPNILNIDARGGIEGAAFSDRTFYAGTDQGLLISRDNGLTWHSFSDLEKNIDAGTTVYDFAFQPDGQTIYVAAFKNDHGVVYATDDNFFTVTPIWTEMNMPPKTIAADSNFLYLGLTDGRLLRYSLASKTLEKVKDFSDGIQNLNLTNGGKNIYVSLASGKVLTSVDFGSVWEEIQGNSRLSFFSGKGLDFKPDKQNPGVLYLASAEGIFRSVNQGTSWNVLNTILPDGAAINSMAVENGNIFVTTGSKLYKSKDGGLTWRIEEPMPTERSLGSLYIANGGELVVVGTKK